VLKKSSSIGASFGRKETEVIEAGAGKGASPSNRPDGDRRLGQCRQSAVPGVLKRGASTGASPGRRETEIAGV